MAPRSCLANLCFRVTVPDCLSTSGYTVWTATVQRSAFNHSLLPLLAVLLLLSFPPSFLHLVENRNPLLYVSVF
ncbi:hypothetical protein BJY01DRAFT_158005 [Aspergillus pseudoustus]|uniref:Uncharacterized protein n=1 Tax=Aspergillus pseudoustus TaxID=1810923 RepID=A0ABR4KXZ2_9EURO